MKKTTPLLILTILLFNLPSFAESETNEPTINFLFLPSTTQIDLCVEYIHSQEGRGICLTHTSFNPERLASCILYSSDSVSEAICLKNKGLTGKQIVDCYRLTEVNLDEQFCLLDNPELESIESMETAIEKLLGYKVEFDPLEELFIFQREKFTPQNLKMDEIQP